MFPDWDITYQRLEWGKQSLKELQIGNSAKMKHKKYSKKNLEIVKQVKWRDGPWKDKPIFYVIVHSLPLTFTHFRQGGRGH